MSLGRVGIAAIVRTRDQQAFVHDRLEERLRHAGALCELGERQELLARVGVGDRDRERRVGGVEVAADDAPISASVSPAPAARGCARAARRARGRTTRPGPRARAAAAGALLVEADRVDRLAGLRREVLDPERSTGRY
jgi:hypothetical protein